MGLSLYNLMYKLGEKLCKFGQNREIFYQELSSLMPLRPPKQAGSNSDPAMENKHNKLIVSQSQ